MSKTTGTCIVKKHQWGSNVKATFYVMRFEDDNGEIRSDSFYLDGRPEATAIVYAITTGYYKHHKPPHCLDVKVKVKTSSVKRKVFVAKECRNILLNIKTEGFDKHLLCQNEWTEVIVIKEKQPDTSVCKNEKVFLYTFDINFTVDVSTQEDLLNVYSELYQEIEFTDFKLRATDGTVPVHKSILFIHSEMFRAMLKGQWRETGEASIDMVGVTVQTLQHLKEYMYLGTIPNTGLEPLLLLARRCLMDKLAAGCIKKLIKNVTPASFNALFDLAFQNNIPELMKGLVFENSQ
ncbi:uncharacterized protein LOC125239615 [Leguminivora glycinivorella]|uniref:uncharacterized protein LOC125239615 n=1 Tax=Leguminivora glycinivorella TaxID=1035111 RepID=UPI00200BB229|nr:uncharacterized protein LOC125239615 [Leguminivora glycinivorella]